LFRSDLVPGRHASRSTRNAHASDDDLLGLMSRWTMLAPRASLASRSSAKGSPEPRPHVGIDPRRGRALRTEASARGGVDEWSNAR
jgi:hypothetical protein